MLVRDAPGTLGPVAAADVRRLRQRCVRTRHLPMLWWHARDGRWPAASAYGRVLGRLYTAMAEVSGASVVVDSSKHPADAYLASTLAGIDLHVVHLVRDPRGSAFSWGQDKEAAGEPDGRLPVLGPLHSSSRWTVWNLAISEMLSRRLGPRYQLLRYEDMARDPRGALQRLVGHLGEPAVVPSGEGATIEMGPTHTVCGNPSRFVSGPVELREDDRWLREMSSRARLLATLPALPLLARYGYSRRRRPAGMAAASAVAGDGVSRA